MKRASTVIVAIIVISLFASFALGAPGATSAQDDDFKITDFMVQLERHEYEEVGYVQLVEASVYHAEGSDRIASFKAYDPEGTELPLAVDESTITPYYWHYRWCTSILPSLPPFGQYTIEATDQDGHLVSVTSWPTDHVSDRVPEVLHPINYGHVCDTTPTVIWQPFSNTTTGYLIEVLGPGFQWADTVPPSTTQLELPELLVGTTYHLLLFAYEGVCEGIQCYRDASVRHIDFTVVSGEIDFDPDVLALRAPLKYVTTYIELPTSLDVSQIDISSVRLNDTVPAESRPTKIGDHDEDGIPDLMVKFDAAEVQSILSPGDDVDILISGEVDGTPFEGTDTIRTLDAGKPAAASMIGSIPYLGYVLAGLAGCFVIAAGWFFYFTRGSFMPR